MATAAEIRRLLSQRKNEYREVVKRSRERRLLIHRQADFTDGNATGTHIPEPYNRSSMVIKTMTGHVVEAAQHYTSRVTANPPVPVVMPLRVKDEITQKADRLAGEQEMFDAYLLDTMGIGTNNRWNMRKCGFAQVTSDAAYYLVMPSDMSFGMPNREYYDDAEAEYLKAQGIVSPVKGERGWAEHPDRWRERRKKASKARATSVRANGLFDLETFPRDMVMRGKDKKGLKWATVIEDIPGEECAPGGSIAMSAARYAVGDDKKPIPMDDWGLYGIWKDKQGKIIGGIERGEPADSNAGYRDGVWTLIRYFDREEVVYLVAGAHDVEGAHEVYREKHGCRALGEPANPLIEVPAMRTDVETVGQEFVGPMAQVFALAKIVNQLMTLLTLAAAFNATPRWVVESKDGTLLRGEDGEPVAVNSAPTPGLDPKEAAAYPGTLRQLVIDTTTLERLLPIYLEQLQMSMPSPAATGDAGSSSAAWLAQQNIQQSQLTLMEIVENHAWAVTEVLYRCHEWLRTLDVPVYFFQLPQSGGDMRASRGLVEFDPADLVDSFVIQQALDTPDERTIKIQTGMALLDAGLITLRVFYDEHMQTADAREAVLSYWQSMIVGHVMGTRPAAPGSMIFQIAEGVRGQVHYELLQSSPNYALNNARSQAQQAQLTAEQSMAMMNGQTPPNAGLAGPVSEANGVSQPAMGMAPTLQGQLGPEVMAGAL